MSAQNLPSEICLVIFRFLLNDRRSLKKCTRVCKAWHSSATQVYFEDISIQAYGIYFIKTHLAMNDCKEYFRCGVYTKKFTIRCDQAEFLESVIRYKNRKAEHKCETAEFSEKDVQFTAKEFLKLLSYMPNLTVIDIGETENFALYLKCLRDHVDPNEYLLEDIKIPLLDFFWSYRSSEKLHFEACYKFRQTLIRLELRNRDYIYTFGDETNDGFGFLSHFPKLTYLDYYSDQDEEMMFFNLQEICLNLIHLVFGSAYPVRDHKIEAALTLMDDSINKMGNTSAKSDSTSPLYFNRNLQVLELNLLTLSTAYIKYILKYIPDHLDTLYIVLTRVDLYDWMDQVGMDNALNLAERLSRIENARLECYPGEEYQSSANTDELKMTQFYKLLGAFKGDRKLYCRAILTNHRTKNELYMKVTNNQRIEFPFELNSEDHVPYEEDISEEDSNDEGEVHEGEVVEEVNEEEEDGNGRYALSFEMPIPDITSSIIGPKIINNLDVCISHLDDEIPYKILKYALVHCPHLQLLQLECIDTQQNICASPHYDMSPMETVECNPLLTLQDNIKKIRMESVPLSADIIDLLSTYLPDLETLVCVEGNHLYRRREYYQIEIPSNMALDMRGLGNLQTFSFDIRTVTTYSFDHLFIHFKYSNGEEDYYNIEPVIDPETGEKECYHFTFKSTTMDFIEECSNKENQHIFQVSFECNKIKEIVLCSLEGGMLAYILDGQSQPIDPNDPGFYSKFLR